MWMRREKEREKDEEERYVRRNSIHGKCGEGRHLKEEENLTYQNKANTQFEVCDEEDRE